MNGVWLWSQRRWYSIWFPYFANYAILLVLDECLHPRALWLPPEIRAALCRPGARLDGGWNDEIQLGMGISSWHGDLSWIEGGMHMNVYVDVLVHMCTPINKRMRGSYVDICQWWGVGDQSKPMPPLDGARTSTRKHRFWPISISSRNWTSERYDMIPTRDIEKTELKSSLGPYWNYIFSIVPTCPKGEIGPIFWSRWRLKQYRMAWLGEVCRVNCNQCRTHGFTASGSLISGSRGASSNDGVLHGWFLMRSMSKNCHQPTKV